MLMFVCERYLREREREKVRIYWGMKASDDPAGGTLLFDPWNPLVLCFSPCTLSHCTGVVLCSWKNSTLNSKHRHEHEHEDLLRIES